MLGSSVLRSRKNRRCPTCRPLSTNRGHRYRIFRGWECRSAYKPALDRCHLRSSDIHAAHCHLHIGIVFKVVCEPAARGRLPNSPAALLSPAGVVPDWFLRQRVPDEGQRAVGHFDGCHDESSGLVKNPRPCFRDLDATGDCRPGASPVRCAVMNRREPTQNSSGSIGLPSGEYPALRHHRGLNSSVARVRSRSASCKLRRRTRWPLKARSGPRASSRGRAACRPRPPHAQPPSRRPPARRDSLHFGFTCRPERTRVVISGTPAVLIARTGTP